MIILYGNIRATATIRKISYTRIVAITKVDEVRVNQARLRLGGNPSDPKVYYGTGIGDVDSVEWRGGELCYNTDDNRLYVQINTSGTTADWYRLAEQFA